MSSDVGQAVNWMLVVALACVFAVWMGIWNHPAALRRIAARYLARADTLEQSRTTYERSLKRWNRRVGIPADLLSTTSSAASEKSWRARFARVFAPDP